MNDTDFKFLLQIRILAEIRRLRADGVTGMSEANLRQTVPTKGLENVEGAPKGTNAPFFYNQIFSEVCRDSVRISNFLLP